MQVTHGARTFGAAAFAAMMALAGCDTAATANGANFAEAKASQVQTLPAMRWGQRTGSQEWTAAALSALEDEGVTLLSTVPSDVQSFCPEYASLDRETRKHFWVGLLSSVAKHESSYNPGAQGGGGRYLGLMQISPATARHYGCDGTMLDGASNMACAVKIAARNVSRDQAIVSGQGSGWRGIARDWMPLRSSSKRADIAGWTSQQSYCAQTATATRPVSAPSVSARQASAAPAGGRS